MIYVEFYDNTKTYYSPAGELYSPEVVGMKLAIVNSGLPVVIETDKTRTIFGAWGTLSQYKDTLGIIPTLTDEEALAEIERLINIPAPAPEPTAEERIASAMEYQNLLAE